MGKGPKPPEAPDPWETAGAQLQSSAGTASVNQLLQGNQVTPWGSQTSRQTGTTKYKDPLTGKVIDLPQMTQTTSLPPALQALFDSQTTTNRRISNVGERQARQLGSILGQPNSAPNLTQVGSGPNMAEVGSGPRLATSYGPTDYSADRAKVEGALMSRMAPMLDQQRSRMTAQLANQGIKVGTEAYDREMANLGQNANDARMQAILAGGGEQSRLAGLTRDAAMFGNDAKQTMFGNNLARAGFNNDARQAEFGNRMQVRGFNNDARAQEFGMGQQLRGGAVNEANALRGGGQVQMPQFGGVQNPQVPNVDMGALFGQQYQGQMNNYNAQVQGRNQMMGGLFGLGASALTAGLPFMLSDERTKTEIEPLGEMDVGGAEPVGVYAYEYKHDPGTKHVGTMAQEVLKVRPDAVVPMGKYLGVNYGKLAGA
jgi:hypothetical protein